MSLRTGQLARKAAGAPLLIGSGGSSAPLQKLRMDKTGYNEDWLQRLAFEHPQVLPVTDIEPGFGEIYAVAREVPCGHGIIDNLFVTATGDIVLVEAKLWRNHQSRREVVAQALDYVAALMGMGYEEFEGACLKGQGFTAQSLHALVADQPDALAEEDFVDAVSGNLARGRILVIALGDGIRVEAEALADLLQSHAGAHFTFALVELAVWQNPATGDLVALPSTLAQTVMITRGIVTVENGSAVVKPVPVTAQARPGSISEELYFEALATVDPRLPQLLRDFVARLEPLGIFVDLRASMNLKVEIPGADKPVNITYITKRGKVWTDALAWTGAHDIALRYNETLAALIGGTIASFPSGNCYVSTNGKSAPPLSALLPAHADVWANAISEAVDALRARASETGTLI